MNQLEADPVGALIARPEHDSDLSGPAQEWCINEAQELAQYGKRYYEQHGGHPNGNNPYARFTGTGYSSTPNVPTCIPRRGRGRLTLVGDSGPIKGIDGLHYRCRSWR